MNWLLCAVVIAGCSYGADVQSVSDVPEELLTTITPNSDHFAKWIKGIYITLFGEFEEKPDNVTRAKNALEALRSIVDVETRHTRDPNIINQVELLSLLEISKSLLGDLKYPKLDELIKKLDTAGGNKPELAVLKPQAFELIREITCREDLPQQIATQLEDISEAAKVKEKLLAVIREWYSANKNRLGADIEKLKEMQKKPGTVATLFRSVKSFLGS